MRREQPEYEYFTSLRADRMYLHSAGEALERARAAWRAVERAQKTVDVLNAKADRIEAKHAASPLKAMAATESLSISLVEYAQPRLEQAYGRFAAECAIVHVACVAAAEASVNALASVLLASGDFDAFDKLSLEGKWRFFPRLIGKTGLDPAKQPLQGLVQAMRYRNALIHHKARREKWEVGSVAPETLKKLGFGLPAAEATFKSTSRALHELSKIIGKDPIFEMLVGDGFFEWQMEKRQTHRSNVNKKVKRSKKADHRTGL